jgi:hypothetical protein
MLLGKRRGRDIPGNNNTVNAGVVLDERLEDPNRPVDSRVDEL